MCVTHEHSQNNPIQPNSPRDTMHEKLHSTTKIAFKSFPRIQNHNIQSSHHHTSLTSTTQNTTLNTTKNQIQKHSPTPIRRRRYSTLRMGYAHILRLRRYSTLRMGYAHTQNGMHEPSLPPLILYTRRMGCAHILRLRRYSTLRMGCAHILRLRRYSTLRMRCAPLRRAIAYTYSPESMLLT